MTSLNSDKVPRAHVFTDLSDYGRPFARWLVARLLHSGVAPNHLTAAFTLVGLAAALLIAYNRALPLAAALLLLKSGLDAADGALARARQQPSRVGRFLDSVCDFVVNVAVFAAIAAGAQARPGSTGPWALAAAALVSALLQVSVFNHYYVRYRAQTGGDQTSQVREAEAGGYPGDAPHVLSFLYGLYRLIYGWQDALVAWLDRLLGGRNQAPITPGFMSAISVLGLGTQLLIIAGLCLLGQPASVLVVFVVVFNLYAIGMMLARRVI